MWADTQIKFQTKQTTALKVNSSVVPSVEKGTGPSFPTKLQKTHSRENPSCLVQMRLETWQRPFAVGCWSQFSKFLAEPCSSGLLVRHLSPSVALCSQQGIAAGAWEPLGARGTRFMPAWCATRQLAASPWCHRGRRDGQSVAFALTSCTNLATGFIGIFGAISAGQLLKYSAAGKPGCSHKWGSWWNPRVALQWFSVTRPCTQEGTLQPLSPHLQFVSSVSFSPYPPQRMQTYPRYYSPYFWFFPWCHIETDLTEVFL